VAYEPWTVTRRLWDPAELGQRITAERVGAVAVEADFLLDEAFVDGGPLRFIGVCRAALNHVDMDAATQHGVLVVNSPARNAPAVAEHTMGLLLALARRIPEAHAYVQSGRWQDPVEPYLALRGAELGGKTLGVVGLGQIGKRVAKLGRAFGMTVVAHDPYATAPRDIPLLPLEEVLRQSDAVTLHAPEPAGGEPLLDAGNLAMMKRGAWFVNTAAAGLVDTAALVAALQEGRLAGAALDVFDSAPLPISSSLLSLPNVVLTPHIGGATGETVARYSRTIADDLLRFLDGKRPLHLVNPEAWSVRRG
jgi:D-3-phosphoglycerate dehydrogenase